MYACYVCYGYITAEAYTHTHSGRAARAGEVRCCAAALGALSRGVVRVAGQREVVRALLEADDAVDDVRGVREDRHACLCYKDTTCTGGDAQSAFPCALCVH